MKKNLLILPLLLLTSCAENGDGKTEFDQVQVVYHQDSDREDYTYMAYSAQAGDYLESRTLNGLYPRLAEDVLIDLGYEREEGEWTGLVPVGRYTLLLEGERSLCSILLPPLDFAADVPAPILFSVEYQGEEKHYLYEDIDPETRTLLSSLESSLKACVQDPFATLTYYR